LFPEYFRDEMGGRVPIPASQVPSETKLLSKEFDPAKMGSPYTSPAAGAWINPGPARGPYKATLADFSTVTYYWYRFIDQPAFQQFGWNEAEKAQLQSFVEKIHADWSLNRDYMPPPSSGALAYFFSLNFGLQASFSYVPIVTYQEGIPTPSVEAPNPRVRRKIE
jgi:hypothetical protein